jgi:hypothetical protein
LNRRCRCNPSTGPTLIAIKRDNISLNSFQEIQSRSLRDGMTTYTDVIIGLPGETYESFANGVSEMIRLGQHNKLNIYNCQVLPNAEMAEPDYRRRYGLECVDLPLNPPPKPGASRQFAEELIENRGGDLSDAARPSGFVRGPLPG